jgi:hypothetical protein
MAAAYEPPVSDDRGPLVIRPSWQGDLDRIWRHLGVSPEGSWDNMILERDLSVEFPGAF